MTRKNRVPQGRKNGALFAGVPSSLCGIPILWMSDIPALKRRAIVIKVNGGI